MSRTPVLDAISAMIRPPFRGLALLVWFYVLWAFLIHPDSPPLCGSFIDADDPMYLAQLLDWLRGGAWQDPVQHRLDPPHGVMMHFSRLALLPLAALARPFMAWGLSGLESALIAAFVWPLMLWGAFLAAIPWASHRLIPRHWLGATAWIALFLPPLLMQFSPGRVDHHALCLLIILYQTGFLVRMMHAPSRPIWAAMAGALGALALAIGLEALPALLVTYGISLFWMIQRGRQAAASGVIFAAVFYLMSFFLLVVQTPATLLFQPDPLRFSIVYVLMTGLAALVFTAVALSHFFGGARVRWAMGVIGGLIAGGVFFYHFPALLSGPYGAMDPQLAVLFFQHIDEARPLFDPDRLSLPAIIALLPLVAGFVYACHRQRRSNPAMARDWMVLCVHLAASLALALFYQRRFINYACLFAIIPLTGLLADGCKWMASHQKGRKRFGAEIALVLFVGPLCSVLIPALFDGRSLNTGVILFPVTPAVETCREHTTLSVMLNPPLPLGAEPRLIMNMINDGPALLARTKHRVLAAPYHTNVRGNRDSLLFFTEHDADRAKQMLIDRGVDLVVANQNMPRMYLGAGSAAAHIGTDGLPVPTMDLNIAQMIATGQQPAWLQPVDFPMLGRYKLYRFVP